MHHFYEEEMLMFRKFFAVAIAATLVAGGLFAEEIQGVFKKFEDNTLTILVPDKDGKEKTFKIDPDLKTKRKGKDGTETEVLVSKTFGRAKEGTKVTVTTDDKGTVTDVKVERGGRGKKKDN
jgi:hypothetical protein